MKKFSQKGILFGFLTIATMSSVLGAVSGTLAWYAYSTRATVSYSGTSVNNTVQLQIGIASPVEIPEFPATAEVEAVQRFDGDSNYYYFAPVGVGLSHEVISTYLEAAGYASDSLAPITSGSYNDGDVLNLKESPKDVAKFNTRSANHGYYAYIPFVFRVLYGNEPTGVAGVDYEEADVYAPNQHLWLTDAKVRASEGIEGNEGSKVHKAIRMFMDRKFTNDQGEELPDYIYNPDPDVHVQGYTTVGGVLDLTGDGFFDFDDDGEIVYGEYEGMDDPDTLAALRQPGLGADSNYVDLNGSGVTDKRTTFTAKHHADADYFADLDGINFKKAHYLSHKEVYPERDPVTGDFKAADLDKAVCKTDANDHYLARLDMTIYLEGWDFAVVDEEMEHLFDLGLTFEINRVN